MLMPLSKDSPGYLKATMDLIVSAAHYYVWQASIDDISSEAQFNFPSITHAMYKLSEYTYEVIGKSPFIYLISQVA